MGKICSKMSKAKTKNLEISKYKQNKYKFKWNQ